MKLLVTISGVLVILNPFVDRMMEGGPITMTLILLCLILSIVLLILGFRSLDKDSSKTKKMIALASDVSLLGLVLGFFGSIIGMISAFDAIEAFSENMSSGAIAGGLKVSFLTTLFGSFVFIISRVGILLLRWRMKV